MNIVKWLLLSLLPCVIVGSRSQILSLRKDMIFYDKGSPPVAGPKRACKLKFEILDQRHIEATNQEIVNCHGTSISCASAENSRYRTMDGSCNNILNPTWGRSDLCLRRILPFDYADDLSHPRISCTGGPLPNPRLLSIRFHQENTIIKVEFTTHFFTWGQVLAHDLSHNDIFRRQADGPAGPSEPIPCCDPGPHICDSCYSIPVPSEDPFFPGQGITCLGAPRTMPCSLCSTSKRVHWNQNTAYHDLSLVYGSNDQEAAQLRSFVRGMLIVEYSPASGPMPPTVFAEERCISQRKENSCYKTGDVRSNQNPLILVAQVYLLRHHNFLCQELSAVNPHWDDERIYQEARRLNIAIAQYITYGQYLPHVLGDIMQEMAIAVHPGYTDYDPELDASIFDEFTTFAARYGHTLAPGRLLEIDPVTGSAGEIWLRDYYFTPFRFRYGQFETMARGMTEDRMHKHDVFLTDDIRNYLYRRRYMTQRNQTTGGDLAALTILRGRDHGIPAYTYYQRYFFNRPINSFDDLKKILPPKSVDIFESLYDHVNDIDTYSASLAEQWVKGGFVGPTFGAVLGEQYRRLKFGDRYWFEHRDQAGSFTPEQLVEIKRINLSRVLCETTRMRSIQRDVFFPPSHSNPVVPCRSLHKLNFHLWKE